jgi:hypothetical protein
MKSSICSADAEAEDRSAYMPTPSARVGFFLREAAPLFTAEKPISFDPVQTTFLQKLIRESVLQEGVTIQKEDFFKGILFVDYFTEVVAGRQTLLEDVRVLVEELEKMDRFLDVNLELLVRYTGLFVQKDLKGEQLFRPSSLTQLGKRHEKTNRRVDWAVYSESGVDLFHGAAGRMVCDLVKRDEVRAYLGSFEGGSNDLKAALVVDSVLAALKGDPGEGPALSALAKGEVLRATTELFAVLWKTSRNWSLRGYVDEIKAKL